MEKHREKRAGLLFALAALLVTVLAAWMVWRGTTKKEEHSPWPDAVLVFSGNGVSTGE